MKVPRDISGDEAVRALMRLGFQVTRQSGSHIQMTDGVRHVTVPAHDPIRVGTLKNILRQAGIELEVFVTKLSDASTVEGGKVCSLPLTRKSIEQLRTPF